MAQALSRLERYAELPEPLVGAMVADEQFLRNFATAEREEDARHVLEVRLSELAQTVVARNEDLRDSIERAIEQINTLQENVDILRDARDNALEERDQWRTAAGEAGELAAHRVVQAERDAARQTEARVESLRKEYEEKMSEAVASAAQAAADAAERRLRPAFDARVRQAQKWTAYWLLGFATTMFSLMLLTLRWNLLHSGRVILIVIWTSMMWVLLLAIPKGWNRMWTAISGVVGILGVALAARELWTDPPKTAVDPATSNRTGKAAP